jgi:DoxX-like family
MNESSVVSQVLWATQGFLALFFFMAGAPKLIGRGLERWAGFSRLPRSLVIFIGLVEVLGAVGLILPMATLTLPWLTPLAAVGLALVVLMAAGFHLREDERLQAIETLLWAALAAVVAVGRWQLVLSRVRIPGPVLVGAVIILVPAVILNIVILVRRPVPGTRLRNAA